MDVQRFQQQQLSSGAMVGRIGNHRADGLLGPNSPLASPAPRRHAAPLSALPSNQILSNGRSYSRKGSYSGGFLGDDSPLLSPLPKYPRQRSVTFAENDDGAREERPHYRPTITDPSSPHSAAGTANGSFENGHRITSILKPSSVAEAGAALPNVLHRDDAEAAMMGGKYRPEKEVNASPLHRTLIRSDASQMGQGTPRRARSCSRQRLALRRQQAQQQLNFYDDSFVEEYVLRAKTEQEKVKEELERQQRERREMEEREREAQEQRERRERDDREAVARQQYEKTEAAASAAPSTSVKMAALQLARDALRAAAATPSGTHSISPASAVSTAAPPAKRHFRSKPDVPETFQLSGEDRNLEEEVAALVPRRQAAAAPRASLPDSCTDDTVADCDATSRKRGRPDTRRSVPIIPSDDDGDDSALGVHGDGVSSRSGVTATSQRVLGRPSRREALEQLVEKMIAERNRARKSGKRSVMVIDLEEVDLALDGLDGQTKSPAEPPARTAPKRARTASRASSRTKGAAVTIMPRAVTGRREPPRYPPVESPRMGSSRRRNESEAPVLIDSDDDCNVGEEAGSLIDDVPEDRQVLLPRRQKQRPPPPASRVALRRVGYGEQAHTTSASNMELGNELYQDSEEDVINSTAAKPNARGVVHRFTDPKNVARPTNEIRAKRLDPPTAPTAAAAERKAAAARRPARAAPPVVSSDDPMAIFFDAAFPSPSKFEEMMMHAGELPDRKTAARGQRGQPALLLPTTISRRR